MAQRHHLNSIIHYDKLSYIASGMHGEVWRIGDTSLVVKVSKSPKIFHDSERQIYERLGEHAHILSYYGEIQVQFAKEIKEGLVFEYHQKGRLIDNLNLGEVSESSQSIQRIWALQISRALCHVQLNHIVHAHLGFQNILLTADRDVKLADFGGSSIDGSRSYAFPSAKCRRTSAIAPAIRPSGPTESLHWEPKIREDTFALGMMVFELWTNNSLYQGLSNAEILDLHDRKIWPSTDIIQEEAVRDVLVKCWSGTTDAAHVAVILEKELREQ